VKYWKCHHLGESILRSASLSRRARVINRYHAFCARKQSFKGISISLFSIIALSMIRTWIVPGCSGWEGGTPPESRSRRVVTNSVPFWFNEALHGAPLVPPTTPRVALHTHKVYVTVGDIAVRYIEYKVDIRKERERKFVEKYKKVFPTLKLVDGSIAKHCFALLVTDLSILRVNISWFFHSA